MIDTRTDRFDSDITDSVANIVLDSLNKTSTPSYHVPGERLGRMMNKENEDVERQQLRRSSRPSDDHRSSRSYCFDVE